MKLSTLFTFNAVVAVLFALGFLLMPESVLALYDVIADQTAIVMSRFFGGAVLGIGLLAWFAKNTEDSEARKAIVLAFFLSNLVGIAVSIHGQLTGEANQLGWSTVAIYILLAAGYGYFQFSKSKEA
ncbi:MAG: hypothetical protein V3T99_02240 [Nitrososphaerales archaeon]